LGDVPHSVEPEPDHIGNPLDDEHAGSRSIRGGALRAMAILVGMLASVVGILFVTRSLGPVRFGTFQTVVNMIAMVAALTEVGLGAVGVREYAQADDQSRKSKLIQTLLGLRLAIATAGVAAAVAISALRGYEMWIVLGTVAAGVGLLGGVAQSSLMIPLLGELRFRLLSMLEIARPVLLSLVYLLVAFTIGGEFAFLAATIPVQVVLLIVIVVSLRQPQYLVPIVDRAAWRSFASTNYALAIATAVGAVYLYAPQLVASFFATALESGYFAMALRTFSIGYLIPATIIVSLFPLLARLFPRDIGRFRETVARLTEGVLVLGVALALALVGGAEFAVRLIGGQEFDSAIQPLQILGIALIGSGFVAVWAYSLIAAGLNRAFAISNVMALLMTLCLVAFLSSTAGAVGASVGTVIGEIILISVLGVFLIRHDLIAEVNVAIFVKITLSGLAVVGVTVLAPLPSAIEMVLAPALFVMLLGASRGFPKGLGSLFPLPGFVARFLP
jgi:O-antigen/teichoic acid export membrane protein